MTRWIIAHAFTHYCTTEKSAHTRYILTDSRMLIGDSVVDVSIYSMHVQCVVVTSFQVHIPIDFQILFPRICVLSHEPAKYPREISQGVHVSFQTSASSPRHRFATPPPLRRVILLCSSILWREVDMRPFLMQNHSSFDIHVGWVSNGILGSK